MNTRELRDADQARRFLCEGIWLQRVLPPNPSTFRSVLEWSLEAASSGQPLPPIGFVGDLGHIAFGLDQGSQKTRDGAGSIGLPAGLARTYEDHVLGKLYADWHFERASDALRRYQGRNRARGLAFLLNQFRERSDFPGVHLSPAILRGMLEAPPEESLARGFESVNGAGPMPLFVELYEGLISAIRRTGELLGPEDIFELEHGTALLELGQRVALRQMLQAANRLESALPQQRVRPLAGRQEVPTRVLDEDTYPVGGYSSLSTRGSIESLLHSQLAYMEKDDRPDLFDIKYLRDELLYYARDENQFLRRRRTFVFALFPDLVRTRFKDADLPWQRIVLVLGLLVTAVRKLSEWLSTDALSFEFLFVQGNEPDLLAHERGLLEKVLREQIANGTVRLDSCASIESLSEKCGRLAHRSLCHCLLISTELHVDFGATDTVSTRLQVEGARPILKLDREAAVVPEGDGPLESWAASLEQLLQLWV